MSLDRGINTNSSEYYVFDKPTKYNGRYLAVLNNELIFKLPQMKVSKLEEKNGRWDLSFMIDIENKECTKLVEFLYKLDESALYRFQENSLKWFNKKFNNKILEESYVPSYDTDKHGNLLFNLNLYDKKLLKYLKSPHIATVKVEGLEFHKNKFKYSIIVTDLKSQDSFDTESRLDFIKCLDNSMLKKHSLNDDVINNLADTDNIQEEYNSITEQNDDQLSEKILSEEILNDEQSDEEQSNQGEEQEQSNKEQNNKEQEQSNKEQEQSDDGKSRISKLELKSMISEKRHEVKSCFENAERANKCAENLRIKAIKVASELRNIESMYN